jgi:hypothetical protein
VIQVGEARRRKIITLVVIALWLPATLSCVCLNVRRLVDIFLCITHIEALNEDTFDKYGQRLAPAPYPFLLPVTLNGETTKFSGK